MTTLTCPKCRHGLADAALDAGQCPLCGFPLDGPVLLTPPAHGRARLLFALGAVVLLAGGVAVYALSDAPESPRLEVGQQTITPPAAPAELAAVIHVAPLPHEPVRTEVASPPIPQVGPPVAVDPPRPVGPRPVGVVMKVDPKIAPKRHFDHPDDTAALPDLNTWDRVVLTGKVRVLRLGSVSGKAVLDASGLVAEEILITGDVNHDAQVLVNAPNGTVTVGGYVTGAAKLTIAAPGGAVTVAGSGRLSGCPVVTVTAKRLEVKCPMSGTARLNATLTAGGVLKLALMEESATVTYKKSVATDPPPTIEKGVLRGGAKVVEGN